MTEQRYTVAYLPPADNIDTALTLLIQIARESGVASGTDQMDKFWELATLVGDIRAELRAMIQTKDDALQIDK